MPQRRAGVRGARPAVGLWWPPLRHRLQLWRGCTGGGWHRGAGHLQWPLSGQQAPADRQKRRGVAKSQNPKVLRRQENNGTRAEGWALLRWLCFGNTCLIFLNYQWSCYENIWSHQSYHLEPNVPQNERQGSSWLKRWFKKMQNKTNTSGNFLVTQQSTDSTTYSLQHSSPLPVCLCQSLPNHIT